MMGTLLWMLVSGCGMYPSESVATVTEFPMPEIHERGVVSSSYHIDDRYMSMRGPYGFNDVKLLDVEQPELLWIVGYRTTVVDSDTQEALSQEFMCHANLDFEPEHYYDDFPGAAPSLSGRVFTLSQGQQDIRFPDGFGIPVSSELTLSLATQVLNLNIDEIDLNVRHKADILFVRDSELNVPMRALYQGAVQGFKALDGARYYGIKEAEADPELHGAGCAVGAPSIEGDVDYDDHGQKFSAHWAVPPGREVNRTNVTRFLNLQFDTTAHYIAVHLHPWSEKLTLRDLTTGEIVYEALVKPSEGRVGLDHVDHLESEEGVKFYKDHEYELISVYDNKGEEVADSMAVMYLYMENKRWKKPTKLEKRVEPPAEPDGDQPASM